MERQRCENEIEISRKKRKTTESSIKTHLLVTGTDTLFPILLAAFFTNSQSLIKEWLKKLHSSLLSQSQPTLPLPILSLLPVFLKSKCAGIARRSAEFVGAASLLSLETNEQIALDDEIMKSLIYLLRNYTNGSVLMAACNAVLDLSTTSVGRLRLLESSALESLLFQFLQLHKSAPMVALCTGDSRYVSSLRLGSKKDEITAVFDAAICLINSCNVEHLEKISLNLSNSFIVILKYLWAKRHSGNNKMHSQMKLLCVSNITINDLAESIFRLSIFVNQVTSTSKWEMVQRSIFHLGETTFRNFMLNYWEFSPFLVRKLSNSLVVEEDVFNSFIKSLDSKGSILSSIVQGLISCVPIASDELDILNFLKDVRNKLAFPLIYEQDIRVLKTDNNSKTEMHFFSGGSDSSGTEAPHFIDADDLSNIEEAFKEGYTIALRGVEFRFESVAGITDGLASLFGQPSVGANIYLTPPNAQGLARHYDDHCVFVCQLIGAKQWNVCSMPSVQLPCLYYCRDIANSVEDERSMAECRHISLREGDILYIPRGFSHEACTENVGLNGTTGFSLHLTLSIEVEPPFEWEGFAHVALSCWSQRQKDFHRASITSTSEILYLMSVYLLHVFIGLTGDSDPTFRKACLVGALGLSTDADDWLFSNQKTIFIHLIDSINAKSGFSESLSVVMVGFQDNVDPFQRLRWLEFLYSNGNTSEDGKTLFSGVETMFNSYAEHKDMAGAFMQVKSKFCSDVIFEDVIESYTMLLSRYKMTRKQYMNGMLALHCNQP